MDDRAQGKLTAEHLNRLAGIAAHDREGLFQRCPHLAVYRDRILAIALCQGGALHYVDGKNGIKDLDVWTLYAAAESVAYPSRRQGKAEFGPSELSGWSERVDLLGRSLPFAMGERPITVWQQYLGRPQTHSAGCLAKKPVVLLEPANLCGHVVWPVS